MPPAFLTHSQSLYDAFDAQATTQDNGERTFVGSLVRVFQSTGLPSPYYGKTMRYLQDMGAVTLVRRGARNSESELHLHFRPSEDDFLKLDHGKEKERKDVANSIRDSQIKELREDMKEVKKKLGIT